MGKRFLGRWRGAGVSGKALSPCISVAVVAVALTVTMVAHAADLRIGFKAEVTSADPHVLNGQNRNVWAHVYESLISEDAKLRPVPKLALSWRAVNPTTWEFKLRPGVHFHDGALMSAEDVKYSIDRAMHLTGARTFRSYLKGITGVTVTGPLTVQISTSETNPTVPDNLGLIAIIPRSLGANVSEESFASGKSAIGTGPYKFAAWINGQKVVLNKNADYWGTKEPWDSVTFQFIPREPARASALLSGAVDIIDGATANLKSAFRTAQNIEQTSVTSYMLNYLLLDQRRDVTPFVRDNNGAPMSSNPFKVPQVRQAMMRAISRSGLIRFLMKADGTASEQLVPVGFFGYDAGLRLPDYDVAAAKALLAEGGYPKGFRMTVQCPNNRYVNDGKLCEAMAQLFSRIGIATEVSVMPFSVFLPRAAGGPSGVSEFSIFMLGTGAVTGDSLTMLTSIVHTPDRKTGIGANNYGGYSNPKVDALIDAALETMDPIKREALQQQAARIALEDGAIIPLLNQNATWAYRNNLSFAPRADGFTMATDIRPR